MRGGGVMVRWRSRANHLLRCDAQPLHLISQTLGEAIAARDLMNTRAWEWIVVCAVGTGPRINRPIKVTKALASGGRIAGAKNPVQKRRWLLAVVLSLINEDQGEASPQVSSGLWSLVEQLICPDEQLIEAEIALLTARAAGVDQRLSHYSQEWRCNSVPGPPCLTDALKARCYRRKTGLRGSRTLLV